jgi:hypothetical protein
MLLLSTISSSALGASTQQLLLLGWGILGVLVRAVQLLLLLLLGAALLPLLS